MNKFSDNSVIDIQYKNTDHLDLTNYVWKYGIGFLRELYINLILDIRYSL